VYLHLCHTNSGTGKIWHLYCVMAVVLWRFSNTLYFAFFCICHIHTAVRKWVGLTSHRHNIGHFGGGYTLGGLYIYHSGIMHTSGVTRVDKTIHLNKKERQIYESETHNTGINCSTIWCTARPKFTESLVKSRMSNFSEICFHNS